MACGKHRHDHQFHIPQETLTEVLSWLPAKSLTRFKSLSKHWLSLITDDPTFADMYKTRKRAPLFALIPPFCYFICHFWDGHFFVMDTDTNHNPRIHNSPSIVTEAYGTLSCATNRLTNIVDGLLRYDLATGRQAVLQINNNARERFVLDSRFCPLRVDEKYTMPLRS